MLFAGRRDAAARPFLCRNRANEKSGMQRATNRTQTARQGPGRRGTPSDPRIDVRERYGTRVGADEIPRDATGASYTPPARPLCQHAQVDTAIGDALEVFFERSRSTYGRPRLGQDLLARDPSEW